MGYLTGGLGIGLLLLGGAFKLYYDSSQSTIDNLQTQLTTSVANTEKLKTIIEDQNKEIEETLKNHEMVITKIESMQKENIEAQATVDRIKASMASDNLNDISLRKPKLLQNILNKGTKRVADEFNTLTSSL